MSVDAQRGGRLREERERLGWSQQQIAIALGIRREMWAKYEAGAEPGATVLGSAVGAGVDVLYVLTGQRGMSSEATPATIDEALLAQVIVGVEQMLNKARKTLPSAKKAQHIAAIYRAFSSGKTADEVNLGQALAQLA